MARRVKVRNGRPSVAVSNVEGVDSGVYELKIDFVPTYRVYFGKWRAGRDSAGRDFEAAGHCDRRRATAWAEYRRRKGRTDHYDRAQQDAGFRKALLTEAMNA
jgi:hypothetical protein